MSDNMIKINGKEYDIETLNEKQTSILKEAQLAQSFVQKIEYEYAVMKHRFDLLVETLAKDLEGGQTAEE